MTTPLIKSFHYHTTIERVWAALTETDQMKQWYFPQLQEFEPVVGFIFRFDDNSAAYRKEWVVTRLVTGKTLAHSWAYKGYPGSSEVLFELLAVGNTTTLSVTQTGLESFPDDPHFQRARFEQGWDNLLGKNLRHLLEPAEE